MPDPRYKIYVHIWRQTYKFCTNVDGMVSREHALSLVLGQTVDNSLHVDVLVFDPDLRLEHHAHLKGGCPARE